MSWKILKKAASYNISHLSYYGLTLEENTPWQSLIKRNKSKGHGDAKLALSLKLTMQTMRTWVATIRN
ncbi:MAG: hypothetical protein R2852_04680 [Bacteroidia bacterium]